MKVKMKIASAPPMKFFQRLAAIFVCGAVNGFETGAVLNLFCPDLRICRRVNSFAVCELHKNTGNLEERRVCFWFRPLRFY
jgi:hypothetical protein